LTSDDFSFLKLTKAKLVVKIKKRKILKKKNGSQMPKRKNIF